MNLHDAPTQILRPKRSAIVPARLPPISRVQRIAVCAVMLMLFELGFALGGYRARRPPKHPALPPVTAVARPAPIELPPIELTAESVIGSEGAGIRFAEPGDDRSLR